MSICVLCLLILTGCGSLAIVSTTNGAYKIEENVSALKTDEALQALERRMERQADEFCGRNGKRVEVVGSIFYTSIPFWRSGSALFEFKCVDR